jgi:hypothetical protein
LAAQPGQGLSAAGGMMMNESFLVLFFKKEQALLFEKRSKNFCSLSR